MSDFEESLPHLLWMKHGQQDKSCMPHVVCTYWMS